PARYLARNPYLPVASALQDVAEAGDTIAVFRTSAPEPWRVINASRLTGVGDMRMPKSEKNHGYFTSAAGATLYRGSAYPESFRRQVFIGEVANNLIHRELLTPQGVTFTSQRIDQGAEFVTSHDNWFRPVNFVNAPDGTLHVLDMYRETIEHPWSIPDDIKARLDLESGRDRGRMYRLAPPGFKPPKPPQLGQATTAELVELLSHENAWHRETAQRLLFQRRDRSAVGPLGKLLRGGSAPLGRLHAMWTLEALGALESADLIAALRDSAPGIRRHAVLLAEPRLRQDRELLDRVLALADDPEIVVRFQVAFTLGEVDDQRAATALTSIARRDAADPWMRAAVLSSTGPHAERLLHDLIADANFSSQPVGLSLLRELAFVVGASSKPSKTLTIFESLVALPTATGVEPLRASVVLGLGEGAKRSRTSVAEIIGSAPPPVHAMFDRLIADAARCAKDPAYSLAARLEAISLIGIADFNVAQGPLGDLLDPRYQREVQLAAIHALSNYRSEPRVADLLLDESRWSTYTPALRVEVVDAVLARPERILKVLDAIAAGKVQPSQIRAARRDMLLAYSDKRIREQAKKVLGTEKISRRADVIAQYQAALSLHGDPARGQQLFERECSQCHRLGARGHEVGPNLATILHRSPNQLLINILDPNREAPPNFIQFTVVLNDGRVTTGIIDSETPTSITLKRAENIQETILRQDIEQLSSTGLSLMPEGVEKKLDRQGLADLLAFLQQSR
ncbi:MAG TPA: HEAT repeat domain-containing protein, partial [Pirellulales bacterium]|nr:HEAT repeat domain-containing protein [Pirellulales bacterium]